MLNEQREQMRARVLAILDWPEADRERALAFLSAGDAACDTTADELLLRILELLPVSRFPATRRAGSGLARRVTIARRTDP